MSVPKLIARGVSLSAIVGREVTSDLLRHLTPWSADRAVPYLSVSLVSTTPARTLRDVAGRGSA